ncbi:MAG: methionyl-tRNA formyltransferase [Candidatus Portnoybacteria bacterium]
MKYDNLKIVFMGTPQFGAVVLKRLAETDFKPSLVLTAPDKPIGRKQIMTPSEVKIEAERNKIPVLQPEQLKNALKDLRELAPDLIIVAAYGYILPKEILDIPKYGCLNIHPSLLPKYRGPSPIQWAILKGEEKTGVTLMKMAEGIDSGPIISQEETEIRDKETADQLHLRLAELGADLLIEAIPLFIQGKIKPKEQEEKEVSFSKILKREYGQIDWKEPAKNIERKVRAFTSWPGTYSIWNEKKIKIIKVRIMNNPNNVTYPTGKVLVVPQNEIGIQCGDGNFLVVEKLQLEGKKEIGAEDFLRGHSDFIGETLK